MLIEQWQMKFKKENKHGKFTFIIILSYIKCMFIKLDLQAASISSNNIWTVGLLVIWIFFFMPLFIIQVPNDEKSNFLMRKIIQNAKFINSVLYIIKMWKYQSIIFLRVSILDIMSVNKEKENISTIFFFASKNTQRTPSHCNPSYTGQQMYPLNYSRNQWYLSLY